MERVESGRDIRVKMFAKLSKENSFDRSGSGMNSGQVEEKNQLLSFSERGHSLGLND
jgi:hypothetical protein